MPHTDEEEKWKEFRHQEERRSKTFKVLEILIWVVVSIIVVAFCLALMHILGYFSQPVPHTLPY